MITLLEGLCAYAVPTFLDPSNGKDAQLASGDGTPLPRISRPMMGGLLTQRRA
jgi:hypothetical protein